MQDYDEYLKQRCRLHVKSKFCGAARSTDIKPTFLSMSYQDPFAGSGDNIPYPHSAIIAARDKGTTTSGKGTNGMVVTLQM